MLFKREISLTFQHKSMLMLSILFTFLFSLTDLPWWVFRSFFNVNNNNNSQAKSYIKKNSNNNQFILVLVFNTRYFLIQLCIFILSNSLLRSFVLFSLLIRCFLSHSHVQLSCLLYPHVSCLFFFFKFTSSLEFQKL